jgi:hypothetical protein
MCILKEHKAAVAICKEGEKFMAEYFLYWLPFA